jgi:hypothetical protein
MMLREAQRNKLLSRVACMLRDDAHLPLLPEKLRRRIEGALRVSAGSARSVRWEVRKIAAALGSAGIPFMLLKGAAYEMAELGAAAGRLFVDVDIMVRREQLEQAERALFDHDWISTKLDAYDQRYYRAWMHEIPPMQHVTRNTSLDVHHTILPPTAAFKPDVNLLWEDARRVPGLQGAWILSPEDMVLHSAVHLFHDGDLGGGLRDLVDLDCLLREFATDDEFWPRLLSRAGVLQLIRPCYYALRFCHAILGTPIPGSALARAQVLGAPIPALDAGMGLLVKAALDPTRENLDSRMAGFWRWVLYVRSHYLRMPLYLLVPHLVRKAVNSHS